MNRVVHAVAHAGATVRPAAGSCLSGSGSQRITTRTNDSSPKPVYEVWSISYAALNGLIAKQGFALTVNRGQCIRCLICCRRLSILSPFCWGKGRPSLGGGVVGSGLDATGHDGNLDVSCNALDGRLEERQGDTGTKWNPPQLAAVYRRHFSQGGESWATPCIVMVGSSTKVRRVRTARALESSVTERTQRKGHCASDAVGPALSPVRLRTRSRGLRRGRRPSGLIAVVPRRRPCFSARTLGATGRALLGCPVRLTSVTSIFWKKCLPERSTKTRRWLWTFGKHPTSTAPASAR